MEILNPEDCIRIGTFLKPHGISGRVILQYELEWELSLTEAEYVLVEIDGLPVPWFIQEEGMRIINQGSAFIDLEWIDDDIAAKKLCGKNVCLARSQIRKDSAHGDLSGWIGYDLYSPTSGFVGTITNEENYSGNLVFTVKTPSGERLVPFHAELFVHSDTIHKKLTLQIAEGLLDL